MNTVARVTLSSDPFVITDPDQSIFTTGVWPVQWISTPGAGRPPFVTAYRRLFQLDRPLTFRAHVSADERYELFLDGQRIGRGSERGDQHNWFFESYDFQLDPGAHSLVARVWSLGVSAPYAQMTSYPGFLFAPEGAEIISLLGTGTSAWECKVLGGSSYTRPSHPAFNSIGDDSTLDAALFPWGFETGAGQDWQPAETVEQAVNGFNRMEYLPAHLLKPATLPSMFNAPISTGSVRHVSWKPFELSEPFQVFASENDPDGLKHWQKFWKDGTPVTVPAHSTLSVLIDLENYYCAYPELTVSGGAGSRVRLGWAEALYREPQFQTKGNRTEIEAKYFTGWFDTLLPDGGSARHLESLWWRSGRYMLLQVVTAEKSLSVDGLSLTETRYPLEMESEFTASDPRLSKVIPLALRTLQMCSHETYMDCPYYEQLMYVGDTRLEVLTTYASTLDDRLPRKALNMFDVSRLTSGLTQSRYPSRLSQIIPPFSLWWIAMVHDFAMWRNDPAAVRSFLPGVRTVIDAFAGYLDSDGLVRGPHGWNFMDWVPAWKEGVPPDGGVGVSCVINWQFAWVLKQAAELEDTFGEPELAARDRRLVSGLVEHIIQKFWDPSRAMFADDLAHRYYSEHVQCLALLSGLLPEDLKPGVTHGLLTASDLARTTIYFTHYLFETYRLIDRPDLILKRLELWFDLPDQGFVTTLEMPEPSRSDCHAWAAHPIYHYFASLLGIRPAGFGFQSVVIEPRPGALENLCGKLVHPLGNIQVSLEKSQNGMNAEIQLPSGLQGEFRFAGKCISLHSGVNSIRLANAA